MTDLWTEVGWRLWTLRRELHPSRGPELDLRDPIDSCINDVLDLVERHERELRRRGVHPYQRHAASGRPIRAYGDREAVRRLLEEVRSGAHEDATEDGRSHGTRR